MKPRSNVRLRQSSTANRRPAGFTIEDVMIEDDAAYVPIMLEIVPAAGIDSIVLFGEIATLSALPARVHITRTSLAESPAIVRAHVRFYDAKYFETKKEGHVARKYRDEVRGVPTNGESKGEPITMTLVEGGPLCVVPTNTTRVNSAREPLDAASTRAPDLLAFSNAVRFRASYDGVNVTVTPDAAGLERYAHAVRTTWAPWFANDPGAHRGALLYTHQIFHAPPAG